MKLISWNVNGIRAAAKGGLLPWFEAEKADVVCFQEIKAESDQLDESLLHPRGYHSFFHSAQKRGYSGVALYSRKEPLQIQFGMGNAKFDDEGRVLVAEFHDFTLINAYFPNSQRDHARLGYKLEFCDAILQFCNRLKASGKNVILCGDYNIAHREIDLKNPRSNQDNAGFLPEERAWMDQFLASDYVDSFRYFCQEPDHYTWWSYRPGVRAKNIGWRIDYFCVNREFTDRLSTARHQSHVRGSDHCPVILEVKT
jgi:exodeoxyribonuclease-3